MHITLSVKTGRDLERLSNEANLPPQRLAELFVEDGIRSYLYSHDGTTALRESLDGEDTWTEKSQTHQELCQRS